MTSYPADFNEVARLGNEGSNWCSYGDCDLFSVNVQGDWCCAGKRPVESVFLDGVHMVAAANAWVKVTPFFFKQVIPGRFAASQPGGNYITARS